MEVRAAYSFVLALFLAMALIPVLVRLAGPAGLLDAGGGRKVHDRPVPRIGGVAIFVGFIVSVLIWVPLRTDLSAFLAAATLQFLFGLLDDRFNLDYRLKLLGQALAAGVVIIAGDVLIARVPFWPGGLLPELLAVPFTILVLVAVTNAVNLSDGLDGLAGGIGLLAAAGLAVLSYPAGDPAVFMVLVTLVGAIFGFLRFNTFPARLFMGDSGSQLLGFSIGVLAIVTTQPSSSGISPVVPLLVLGLPILDTLTVMTGRIRRGQSPFTADRTHLHHRLLDAGLSHKEAVGLIYGAQFLLMAIAYLLRERADGMLLLTYLVFCALALLGLRGLEHYRSHGPHRKRLVRARAWLLRLRALRRLPLQVLAAGIPLFLAAGALASGTVGPDIGVLALTLLVLLAALLLTRRLPILAIERLSAYTTAIAILYLLAEAPPGLTQGCKLCLPVLFWALALSSLILVRAWRQGFRLTTLDVLILLAALTAPLLRDLGLHEIGLLALKAIVLFYGIEILMLERERRWDALRVGVIATLAILAARGLT